MTDELLERVVRWVEDEPAVRMFVLTGSAARGTADPLSDLDVELYVDDPSRLLDDDAWYRQFGEVLVVEALENPGWHPTRLVYYAGAKIDFMVAPVEVLADVPRSQPFAVLVDKDGRAGALRPAVPASDGPPDEVAFERCNHWFHAAALMCARAVARGEPWQAKARDWDAKQQLLQMLDWDHRVRHGWAYETGHGGKGLNQWVDADVHARLDRCWAAFGLDETAVALTETLELFDLLSSRTAESLGLPPFDAGPIRTEVARILRRPGTQGRHP